MSEQTFEKFEQCCRKAGLALTVQRRTIFEELRTRKDHPTADQVFEVVRHQLPGLSRTTVYRVLETFVRVGAAQKLSHAGATVRYDPNVQRHHHLVCERCGELEDIEITEEVPMPKQAASGFAIRDYSINFTGICNNCRAVD